MPVRTVMCRRKAQIARLKSQLTELCVAKKSRLIPFETSPRIKLTEMEIKVMEQLAKGKSNQQIAIALLEKKFLDKTGLEEEFPDRYETIGEYMDEVLDRYTRLESRTTTVQTHLVNIKNKYGGPSRGQLIRIAIENYGGLENKRPISPEEIAVLESLHYGVAPKQIARTLAISEIDVEKIRKKSSRRY